ncbi:unnamed protein product [Effrenium voratum]|uniref:Ion transport domain-containing protein n=1 Tax=Effrenium voratum TaxID=2562239 RepID=A0AA36HVU7_9DINO|nr:unnamed protein product [Effrenium voratum]
MLPAVRDRLDFLGAEYERIALENERLRAELLELGSPGSQNGEVARNITAKIAALRDPASCKAIVTSHTPASPMSPTKEVWMDGSRMPELHAKITCDDLIPGAVADCDEASMISKDEPISEGTSAARLRSDRRISKGSRTEPPVEEPEEQVSRLIFLDVIPAVIISINAAVVGLSADICPEHTVWVGLEMFFTGFFTLEILVKMKVFGVKGYLWGADWYWSWFDCFCVLLAYLEMGMSLPTTGLGSSECGLRESDGGAGFGALKMLKLARLGRIVRLLKFKIFVELKLMIQGVFTGLRVLFWAIMLLFGCIYLLGVVCKTLFSNYAEFSTVPASMFTAFRCFTDGCAGYDGTPLQERIRKDSAVGGVWMIAYILVFLFITIGIFNLIMAVFIDNVNDGSVKKKQYTLGLTADKTELKLAETLRGMCLKSGVVDRDQLEEEEYEEMVMTPTMTKRTTEYLQDYEGRCNRLKKAMTSTGCMITKRTFNSWLLQSSELLDVLDDAEVDTSCKFELFDVLDIDLSGKLPFSETVEGLMRCRGPVSKTDIISIRLRVRHLTRLTQQIHKKLGCHSHK